MPAGTALFCFSSRLRCTKEGKKEIKKEKKRKEKKKKKSERTITILPATQLLLAANVTSLPTQWPGTNKVPWQSGAVMFRLVSIRQDSTWDRSIPCPRLRARAELPSRRELGRACPGGSTAALKTSDRRHCIPPLPPAGPSSKNGCVPRQVMTGGSLSCTLLCVYNTHFSLPAPLSPLSLDGPAF